MSSTQVVLIVLAVVIFAAGWVARGRREANTPAPTPAAGRLTRIDEAIAAALTAFQAVLGMLQAGGQADPALGRRVFGTFDARRQAVADLAWDTNAPAQLRDALTRVDSALDRLTQELLPLRDGAVLDVERERALFRAERGLVSARTELLLAAERVS